MDGGLKHCTGGGDQSHLKKKKEMQEGKVSEEALQIAEERSEKQGRKGKVHRTKCRSPKNKVETSRPFSINSGNRGKQQKGKD